MSKRSSTPFSWPKCPIFSPTYTAARSRQVSFSSSPEAHVCYSSYTLLLVVMRRVNGKLWVPEKLSAWSSHYRRKRPRQHNNTIRKSYHSFYFQDYLADEGTGFVLRMYPCAAILDHHNCTQCSSISSSTCKSLGELDGIPVHAGLLLERTKRNSKVVDATRKVKSLMMYTDLADGGVLVRHIVSVFNTTVPSYGAWVMNNLGSFGANEATETAVLTRKFLSQKLYRQVPKNMRGPGEGGTKK